MFNISSYQSADKLP